MRMADIKESNGGMGRGIGNEGGIQKEGDGNSNKGRQRGWRASDGNKGNGNNVGNGNGNEVGWQLRGQGQGQQGKRQWHCEGGGQGRGWWASGLQ